MATQKASDYLRLAYEHLKRAEENPSDADSVFVWGFWSLENAVKAASIRAKIEVIKQHWSAGAAARKLAKSIALPNVSDLLSDLNQGRKAAAYGDTEEPDLEPNHVLESLRDYLAKVSSYIKT